MATQEELEQRIADLEKRLTELQGGGDTGGIFSLIDAIVPPETRQHLRTARKHQLLAFRSVLDKWIARMDDEKPTP